MKIPISDDFNVTVDKYGFYHEPKIKKNIYFEVNNSYINMN